MTLRIRIFFFLDRTELKRKKDFIKKKNENQSIFALRMLRMTYDEMGSNPSPISKIPTDNNSYDFGVTKYKGGCLFRLNIFTIKKKKNSQF